MKELMLNENKKIIVKDYIQRYLDYIDVSDNTIKTYNVGLLQFIEYLKNKNIQEPVREDIIAFREYLKAEQLKPNTIRRPSATPRMSWSSSSPSTINASSKTPTEMWSTRSFH